MNRTSPSFIGADGIAGQQLNNEYNLGAGIKATVILNLDWAKQISKRSRSNFVQFIDRLCLFFALLAPMLRWPRWTRPYFFRKSRAI